MPSDPFDMLLANLRGEVPMSLNYMPKEVAYRELKMMSGEDWGYDAEAWAARKKAIWARWRAEHPPESRESMWASMAELKRQHRKSMIDEFDGPPCPECGAKIASKSARQCLKCGADWHDDARDGG